MENFSFSITFKSQFQKRTVDFYDKVISPFCRSYITVNEVPLQFYYLMAHIDMAPIQWNDSFNQSCITISGEGEDNDLLPGCPEENIIDMLRDVLKEISRRFHLCISFRFTQGEDLVCSTEKCDDWGDCTFRLEKEIQEFDLSEEIRSLVNKRDILYYRLKISSVDKELISIHFQLIKGFINGLCIDAWNEWHNLAKDSLELIDRSLAVEDGVASFNLRGKTNENINTLKDHFKEIHQMGLSVDYIISNGYVTIEQGEI